MKKYLITTVLIMAGIIACCGFGTREQHVYIVRMEGMKFIPNKLEVPEGATVCWVNESNGAHNVVDKGGLFKSEILTHKGEKYQYRFLKQGTYSYYCAPHRIMGMKGVVVVK